MPCFPKKEKIQIVPELILEEASSQTSVDYEEIVREKSDQLDAAEEKANRLASEKQNLFDEMLSLVSEKKDLEQKNRVLAQEKEEMVSLVKNLKSVVGEQSKKDNTKISELKQLCSLLSQENQFHFDCQAGEKLITSHKVGCTPTHEDRVIMADHARAVSYLAQLKELKEKHLN